MSNLVNFVQYQVGWFACVGLAAAGRPWLGASIALGLTGLHVALCVERRREWMLVLSVGGLGLLLDSSQAALGLLQFAGGHWLGWPCPPWILAMWMQFATLPQFGLSWLAGRPRLTMVLGAIGGPVAFAGGRRMGAVEFHPQLWPSLLGLAIAWAIAMPAMMRLAARLRGPGSGRYRGRLGA